MKALLHIALTILLGCALATAAEKPKQYVCDPCGMACDKTVYDKPGTCPVCGARLVDKEAAEAALASRPAAKKVAILIFNGVEIIDYAGPCEVFGAAGFDVYTVAETKDAVTTAMGMTVVPKYTLADAPRPDILLVPGGDVSGPRGSATTLKWIKETTGGAQTTMSVCNGAFTLASAGLLDGLSATTTYHLLDKFKSDFPNTTVVRDQRFVDNGKIITAGGLTSGIDGALHVVSKVLGNGTAQEVALGLEYDWRPRAGFSRGALAVSLLPDLDLDDLGRFTIVSTEGGTDRWDVVARATSDLSGREIFDRIGQALTTRGKWTSVRTTGPAPSSAASSSATSSSPLTGAYKFTDARGKHWTASLTVQPVPAEKGQYTAKLSLESAGQAREARADRSGTASE
jgi:putative intracellular protease/amidase